MPWLVVIQQMPYSGLLRQRPSQLWKERSTIWRSLEIPKIRYPKLVKKECKRYIAGLYGDFEELTEARYKIYASKVTKNESALPPSENASKYHIQIADFQTLVWKRAHTAQITEMPSPWNMAGMLKEYQYSVIDHLFITKFSSHATARQHSVLRHRVIALKLNWNVQMHACVKATRSSMKSV